MLTAFRTAIQRSLANDDESGFTLIELLFVAVIGGVVSSVVLSAIVQSLRTSIVIEDRVDSLAQLEKGMQRVTRELRAANPLQLDFGGDYFNAVTATVTRGGERIAYRYEIQTNADGTQDLLQRSFVYDLSGNLVPGGGVDLVTKIENASQGVNLFRYFDAAGEELVCPPAPASCLTTLLGAEQVEFTLLRTIEGAAPLQLQSTIRIRSLRYTSDPTNLGIIVGELQP